MGNDGQKGEIKIKEENKKDMNCEAQLSHTQQVHWTSEAAAQSHGGGPGWGVAVPPTPRSQPKLK